MGIVPEPVRNKIEYCYDKYLTNLVFSAHTVSYGSLFFPLQNIACALRAWAILIEGQKTWSVTYGTDLELG